MSQIPQNLLYSHTHEWCRREGDTAIIGLSDHAQDQLGSIVFVELPALGRELVQGQPLGVVESIKTLSDIYAPLSGTVIAVNDALTSAPELINDDCYDKGWCVQIRPSQANAEISILLDPDAYSALLDAEEH